MRTAGSFCVIELDKVVLRILPPTIAASVHSEGPGSHGRHERRAVLEKLIDKYSRL